MVCPRNGGRAIVAGGPKDSAVEIGISGVTRTLIDEPTGTYRFAATLDLQQTPVPLGDYYLYLKINNAGTVVAGYGSTGSSIILQNGGAPIRITIKARVMGMYWMGDAGRDLNGDGTEESIVFAGLGNS